GQARNPGGGTAEPSQAGGGIQFRTADQQVQAAGLLQPAEVGRAEPDHGLAEGDHIVGHWLSLVCLTMATYCRARSRMRSKLPSATARGSTSWPPMPRLHAPARRNAAAVLRSTPPVGINRMCGRGPRSALKNAGPTTSAGKTLMMSAPASQAARISVGVKAPGITSLS